MADEASKELPEITPEDFGDDDQDTSPAKPAPKAADDADKKPEAAKPADDTKAPETPKPPASPEDGSDADDKPSEKPEGDEDKGDEDPDADKPEGDEDPTAAKPRGADARKDELKSEIRDLVAVRNGLKADVSDTNAKYYKPASQAELEDAGMDPLEAKVEAMRQQGEMRDYNDAVVEAQLTIESESQRVLHDFPIFDPDSEDYNKELADSAANLFEKNLVLDPNTKQIIGSNVSPYELYQTIATAANTSKATGEIAGKKAVEKQLANVDSAPSATKPVGPKVDPVTEMMSDL